MKPSISLKILLLTTILVFLNTACDLNENVENNNSINLYISGILVHIFTIYMVLNFSLCTNKYRLVLRNIFNYLI